MNIRFKEDMIFNVQAFCYSVNIIMTNNLSYNYIINKKSASFKYIDNYINEIKKFKEILVEIVNNNNLNLKEELYICMSNMYMNWLKLCIMHKKSKFSKKDKIKEIRKSFCDEFWVEIFKNIRFKKLTNQYKILYILYKLKLAKIIYMIVNINMCKNEKKFR